MLERWMERQHRQWREIMNRFEFWRKEIVHHVTVKMMWVCHSSSGTLVPSRAENVTVLAGGAS